MGWQDAKTAWTRVVAAEMRKDLRAILEVKSTELGDGLDAGAERERERGIKIVAVIFLVNPPSFSVRYLGCFHHIYIL